MKDIIYILIVISTASVKAFACGPFERNYLASDYYMFRICGDDMTGNIAPQAKDYFQMKFENCNEWSSITNKNLPYDDVMEVVYKWSIENMLEMRNAISDGNGKYTTDNLFANWIVSNKDRDVSEFLILAKRCEHARLDMVDPWYYAVEGDEASTELYEIIEQASSFKGKRLRDRYVLQQIRALFSLKHYDECLNVWEANKNYFKNNVIKELTLGYIAGSHYHLGEKEEAIKIYLQNDDYSSAYKYAESKSNFTKWLYDIEPDNKMPLLDLQEKIHDIETHYCSYGYEEFYPFIERIIDDGKCKHMAAWYYAAAFVADKLGKSDAAMTYINLAKNANPAGDLYKSIRVLDIYLTIKNADAYTESLENYVYRELEWLDKEICNNLSEYTKAVISKYGIENHICGYSQYYWNDMMRKIVIGEIVPLCLKSGYKTRALQYLNMADYRIFKLASPDTLKLYDSLLSGEAMNQYDYSNDYFMNLDSLGVKYLIRLSERMEHPLCPLDTFLNERSYKNPQYLYEIIGTQLIASRKYGEACAYLSKVTPEYNRKTNVFGHCNIDPFTGNELPEPDAQYKLHFAQKMYDLERKFKSTCDRNDKAEILLTYTCGLQSSIGRRCWPLTSYYWGWFICFPLHSQYQTALAEKITAESERFKKEAFALFTDKERAAKAYYDWKMFKTVATKYKDTEMGKYVLGKCDNLVDYHIIPDINPGRYDL